ncbi:MAG TPA: lysylphosphatidylglycerol synthase domain-containing protein [Candidatus Hydrogenedentes bacterium]|nr:lysylphosphatidylglycerol synthase domain-containing protein [Candidatus Hydrogenedentota bacterium]
MSRLFGHVIRHRKLVTAVVLLALTAWGGRAWLTELRETGLSFWGEHVEVLALIGILQACDIFLDGIVWWGLLRAAGYDMSPARAGLVFLAGYAGLLAPVQLGRLVRPIELNRAGDVPVAIGVMVEVLLLAFSGCAGVVVLGAALLWPRIGWLAPLCALVVLAGVACVCRYTVILEILTAGCLPGLRRHFVLWAVVFLTPAGWLLNGCSLWLVSGREGAGVSLWELFAVAPSNMIIGALSGMPGGIGAVEAWLGTMLSVLGTKTNTLVNEVLLFRLMTFWVWIPIGWLALLWLWRGANGGMSRDHARETS